MLLAVATLSLAGPQQIRLTVGRESLQVSALSRVARAKLGGRTFSIDLGAAPTRFARRGDGALAVEGRSGGWRWKREFRLRGSVLDVSASFVKSGAGRTGSAVDRIGFDVDLGSSERSLRIRPGEEAPVFLGEWVAIVTPRLTTPLDVQSGKNVAIGVMQATLDAGGQKFTRSNRSMGNTVFYRYSLVSAGDLRLVVPKEMKRAGLLPIEDGYPQAAPVDYQIGDSLTFGELEEEMGKEGSEEGPWWTKRSDDFEIGAPREPGWVSFEGSRSAMRAAWGLRWWAEKYKHKEWEERAEQLVHLRLSAPWKDGEAPGRFDIKQQLWKGEPNPEDAADTAYWMLRWREKWPLEEEAAERADKLVESIVTGLAAKSDKNNPKIARLFWLVSKSKRVSDALKRLDKGFASLNAPSTTLETWEAELELNPRRFPSPTDESILSSHPYLPVGERSRWALAQMRLGAVQQEPYIFELGALELRRCMEMLSSPLTASKAGRAPALRLGQAAYRRIRQSDQFSAWKSFESCEGALAASWAEALDEFGGVYTAKEGWTCGVDYCTPQSGGGLLSLSSFNTVSLIGQHAVERVSWDGSRSAATAVVAGGIVQLGVIERDGRLQVLAVPNSSSTAGGHEGEFYASDGSWRVKASLGATGFVGAVGRRVLETKLIGFRGTLGGKPVSVSPRRIETGPRTWVRTGQLADTAVASLSSVSTGDGGARVTDPTLRGRILSCDFWPVTGTLRIKLTGGGHGCRVKLVDAMQGVELAAEPGAPGRKTVTWNLKANLGRPMRIEVEDDDRRGWLAVEPIRN